MAACACRNAGCSNMGIPFPTDKGPVCECKQHTQDRVQRGEPIVDPGRSASSVPKRKSKKIPSKQEGDSPIMPHLEPVSTDDCPPLGHSSSSATLSTGTSKGELTGMMKEFGGRDLNGGGWGGVNQSQTQNGSPKHAPQPPSMDDAPVRDQPRGKSDRNSVRSQLPSILRAGRSTRHVTSSGSSGAEDSPSPRSFRSPRGRKDRKRIENAVVCLNLALLPTNLVGRLNPFCRKDYAIIR